MSIESTYITLAQLTEICAAHGVKYAVLSPGSRSAPLALSIMRNEKITHFVLTDERSAAYTALGIARQTQSPVVLVCTSGTAALNYAPAVAEAFFCELPLIVITADRPPEWIAQADNQSIYQENIYGKHIKYFANLPLDFTITESIWHSQRQMNEALIVAKEGKMGPVHINVPLREPLYMLNTINSFPAPKLILRENLNAKYTLPKEFINKIRTYKKILVVAGMHAPDAKLIRLLEQMPNLCLMADVSSNLHDVKGVLLHTDLFCDIEKNKHLNTLCPELVISIGGPIVSKHVKNFLRKKQIQEHWHIGLGNLAADTYQHLNVHIPAPANEFFHALLEAGISFNKKYAAMWQQVEEEMRDMVEKGFKKIPFSESAACWKILKAVPERSILHIGNSLAIRHLTSFPYFSALSEIYANRGTSGIDGSVSSAAGHSMTDERMHILFLGDLSFMYDSNGLWNKYLKGNLKIVILNNFGGRIFESLPGASVQAELNEYFVTEQNLNFESLAKHFNANYFSAENDKQLNSALTEFFKVNTKVSILELKFKNNLSLGEIKKKIQGK